MSDTSSPITKKDKKKSKSHDDDADEEVIEYASEEESEKHEKKAKHSKTKEKEKEKKKAKDKSVGIEGDVEIEKLKDEIRFHLDPKKKLCVSRYKGNLQVNIREFYEKDGELLPTKKGCTLNIAAWNNLKKSIDKIDEALKKV